LPKPRLDGTVESIEMMENNDYQMGNYGLTIHVDSLNGDKNFLKEIQSSGITKRSIAGHDFKPEIRETKRCDLFFLQEHRRKVRFLLV
jgi:hypothetical protein